ncbi:MAG: carboxypeptidase-like regulatory domain-containing protein [Chitinophagales bacterium]
MEIHLIHICSPALKKVFTIIFCVIAFAHANGQTISGIVNDGTTNEPLIGATVFIREAALGAITDEDGKFEWRIDQSFPITLQISYLGYIYLPVKNFDGKSFVSNKTF